MFCKKIVLMIMGFVLALAVSEILFRSRVDHIQEVEIHLLSSNELGQKNGFRVSDNKKLVYEPTSWMRDPDEILTGSNVRVLVLGDSTSLMDCVNHKNNYPGMLEEMFTNPINTRDIRDIRVFNAAVPGYNTEQELELFKQYFLSFSPDIVIVGCCLENDRTLICRTQNIKNPNLFKVKYLVEHINVPQNQGNKFLMEHSALFRAFSRFLAQITRRDTRDYYLEHPQQSFRTRRALQAFKQLSEEYNFKLIFLLFPSLSDNEGINAGERQWFQKMGSEYGIEMIDFYDLFAQHNMLELRLNREDTCHFNTAGHRLVAEQLFFYLENKIKIRNTVRAE